jgi:aspartate-semialdehyde dehydrogenase
MAISYESAGQQVGLSGSQTSPNFQPRQVAVTPFDPSRQMLQQSETDLSAFAKFSETLNAFLKTKGEEKIKQEKARGFSKFLDGKVAASPKTISQFQVNKAAVDAGAAADLAVANAAKDDPTKTGVAATIVAGSPALRGWEAVGYAEAQVQAAPADLENYLSSNRRSAVPVQLEDGRMLAPIAATGTDISLVIKALREQWFTQSGINNINPVLIQANGGYNIAMAERQVMSNWQKEDDAKALKNVQYDQKNRWINGLRGIYETDSPEYAKNFWSSGTNNLKIALDSGADVNAFQLESIGNELEILAASKDIGKMERLLERSGSQQIEGLKMTFRQRNEAAYRKFDLLIDKAREGRMTEINDSEKAPLDAANTQFQSLRQTGTPEQIKQARVKLNSILLNSPSPYARELYDKLESQDGSIRLYETIDKQIKSGNKGPGGRPLWTQSDIQKLAMMGPGGLETDQSKTLMALLPEDKTFADRLKFVAPNVKNLAIGQLTALLGRVGATYGIDKGFTARLEGTVDLAIRLSTDALEKRYGGVLPSEDQIRRDLLLEVMRRTSAKTEEVYIDRNTGKMPNMEAGTKKLPTGKPPAPEPLLTDTEINRLTTKAGVLPTQSPKVERVDANYYDFLQKVVTEGGTIPADILGTIQMTGLSTEAWMKAQGAYHTPFVPNPDKEAAYRRNYAIDPAAANILRNPRSTTKQLQSALKRIRDGASPATVQSSSVKDGAFSGAGNFGGLPKLISSGEGGFNSVNLGTTYSGKQMNLTSMNIGDVENLQNTKQIFAAGFAQWVPSKTGNHLTMARTAANLPPTAKMTPENQLKMFWAYVLKTNKQPVLRDYLLGKNNDLNGAQNALAGEWAAVKNTSGVGYYDDPKTGNKATIDQAATRRSLLNARREIRANLDVILKSLE